MCLCYRKIHVGCLIYIQPRVMTSQIEGHWWGYLTSKSEQIKTMNPDIKTQTTQLAINTHEPSAYLLNRYIYRLNNSRKDN